MVNMKKLNELLAKKQIKGDVGIEIECEGDNLQLINTDFWGSEDDGSLRGKFPNTRAEYVLKKPIVLEKVKDALVELNDKLKDSKLSFSYRTSVHVHVNVLGLTEDQLFTMIYTYFLLEDVLFNYCGNGRKANRFCLRLQDSDELSMLTLEMIHRGPVQTLLALDETSIRYSAINFAALTKYGSIEFRGMRGTADVETITTWASALVSIRNFACHVDNCLNVHDLFVEMGPEKFVEHVLKDLTKSFKYSKMEKDLYKNFSLAIDIPYTFKYTKEHKKEAPKPVEAKAPLKFDWVAVGDVINHQAPVLKPPKPDAAFLEPNEFYSLFQNEWWILNERDIKPAIRARDRIDQFEAEVQADEIDL
jgi:hypothetical protein